MTTRWKIVIGVGVVVVIAAIVIASLLAKSPAKGEPVYMAKAARNDVVSGVSATGRIQPRTKVNVQSMVIGEIVKLPVKEGDAVRKGDLLVQIDPDRYKAEVDRLAASVRVGRIGIEQQEASLEQARRTLTRNRALFEKSLIAPDLLERSELEVRAGEINLRSLKEQVSQAQAALEKAQDELRKTTITSPMDGVVTQLNAEVGEMTLTGTMNNPGTVIMVVSDMGEVLAEVDVDENRFVQVEPGQKARVVVDAVGETHPYFGKVTELGGTATKRAGQDVLVFAVKVALDQPDARLRPGMTAKARIETKRAEKAVTVPIQAVLLRSSAEYREALEGRKKKGAEPKTEKKEETGGSAGKSALAAEKKEPAASTAAAGSSASAAASGSGGKNAGGAAEDKQEFVFKVVDGKAVLTLVKTGIGDDTNMVVLEGVSEGDSVITGPYRTLKKLKDGEAVKERTEKDEKAEAEAESSGARVE